MGDQISSTTFLRWPCLPKWTLTILFRSQRPIYCSSNDDGLLFKKRQRLYIRCLFMFNETLYVEQMKYLLEKTLQCSFRRKCTLYSMYESVSWVFLSHNSRPYHKRKATLIDLGLKEARFQWCLE